MPFRHIKGEPENVLDVICSDICSCPNLAVLAYHIATSHSDFGMIETANAFYNIFERIKRDALTLEEVSDLFEQHLDPDDDGNRQLFSFAQNVDELARGRFEKLDMERRKQFVQMTFDLAEQGYHNPRIWSEHFLQSASSAA